MMAKYQTEKSKLAKHNFLKIFHSKNETKNKNTEIL